MDDDPRVAGERVGELAPPDVDGVDAGGAALEQDVGEAAGRRADVEADEPRRVDAERVERGGELVAAAADVRVALRRPSIATSGVDEVAGLPVEPPGVARPDADLAGEDQGLGPRPGLGEAALDEELVQALPRPRRTPALLTRLSWHSGLHRRSRPEAAAPTRSRGAESELGQRLADLRGEAVGVEAEHASQVRDGAVVDEPLARDAEDPDRDVAERRVRQARLLDRLEDAGPEPAGHDALLERHDERVPGGRARGSGRCRAAWRTGR